MPVDTFKEYLEKADFGFVHFRVSGQAGLEILEYNPAVLSILDCAEASQTGVGLCTGGLESSGVDWQGLVRQAQARSGYAELTLYLDSKGRWYRAQVSVSADGTAAAIFEDVSAPESDGSDLEQLFEINLDLLCIADVNGHFLKVNSEWVNILGWDREMLENHSFLDLVHPDDLDNTRQALSLLAEQKQVTGFRNRFRTSSGPYRWLEWRSRPRGHIIYAAAQDITDRLDNEEVLRASEENLRSFFHTIDDIFIIAGMDGRIIQANAALTAKLGYSPAELSGMPILELHPPEVRDEAGRIINEMIAGSTSVCPLPLQARSGNTIPVETRVWLGRWNGRRCVFGISKDLSVERAALDKFNRLFMHNPALMALSSMSDRRFTDVNAAFLSALGYERDEVIGRTSSELNLFVEPERQREMARYLLETGNLKGVELQVRRRDGRVLTGLFSGEVIDNQLEKSLLTVMFDITRQKELQKQSDEQKSRLSNILEGTNAGTWEWNVTTGETVFNEKWAEIIGFKLSELEPTTIKIWEKYTHPDDLAASGKALELHFSGVTPYYECEARMKHRSGNWVWILDRGKVVEWTHDGKPVRMFGTHIDITERKKAEKELRESRELLDLFFEQSMDGFFFMMLDEPVEWNDQSDKEKILDTVFTRQRVTRINKAMLDQYGAAEMDFLGRTPSDFYAHDIAYGRSVWMEFFNKGKLHIDTMERKSDGSEMIIEGDYICMYDESGRITGHFGVQRDVTFERRALEELKRVAIHDGLTGIYNRRHVMERLQGALERSNRGGPNFALAMIDIDHFKNINDSFGHLAGDYVLTEISAILKKSVRTYDVLGRYGGEEFLIIFEDSTREKAGRIMDRILCRVTGKPFVFGKQEIGVSFSCGVADVNELRIPRPSVDDLISIADARLYEAKNAGRSRVVAG